MSTLRDAKCGDTVKVVKIHGEGAVRRRIMDMGITKNVELYIRKVAPLGDPVEVTVILLSASGAAVSKNFSFVIPVNWKYCSIESP